MNHAELHFVLGLQLAELRPEDGGVVCFGEKRRGRSGANRDVASFGSLTQRPAAGAAARGAGDAEPGSKNIPHSSTEDHRAAKRLENVALSIRKVHRSSS